VLTTIVNVLRNAFVHAFKGSLEHSVSLGEVANDKDKSEEPAKKEDKSSDNKVSGPKK